MRMRIAKTCGLLNRCDTGNECSHLCGRFADEPFTLYPQRATTHYWLHWWLQRGWKNWQANSVGRQVIQPWTAQEFGQTLL